MSPEKLRAVLAGLPKFQDLNLLVGMDASDDAGVYRLGEETALVQTLDFFAPIVDDPYTFGRIAAANALSDVYAMGGKPLTAMNIACFPDDWPLSILSAIIDGAVERLRAAGAVLVGGHTVKDREIKFGLSVTGVVHPARIRKNGSARPGDQLVLTKPLGTGIVCTAMKHGTVDPSDRDEVYASMTALNAAAAGLMDTCDVHAATDVTGFGFLGHALEMAAASGVRLVVRGGDVPVFTSALTYARDERFRTAAADANKRFAGTDISVASSVTPEMQSLLFDPQTSGGLLMSVNPRYADALVDELRRQGVPTACLIGGVEEGTPHVLVKG